MKFFYVCSYGGSGSKMLCEYLSNFGTAKHIHSRNPPEKLTYFSQEQLRLFGMEQFGDGPIPDDERSNYYVIFIYKNPIKAIYSRFSNPGHLSHIQCDSSIKYADILSSKKDLYGIEEFFDNYTTANPSRNYKIYCVKYEELFDKIPELNSALNIQDKPWLFPEKIETNHDYREYEKFETIYSNLINKMNKMGFLHII